MMMPFEIIISILLVWVGQSLYRIQGVISRYPSNFWLWKYIDDLDFEYLLPWYSLVAAFLICLGLFRVACGCGRGRALRSAGLAMGVALFIVISYGHISVTFWTIGGAAYFFIAWLTAILIFYVVRRG